MTENLTSVKARYTFIDALVVLLNISAGRGNYLLFGLLGMYKTTHVLAFVIFIDLIYLFFRIKFLSKQNWGLSVISVAFILLIYNWFNVLRHGTDGLIPITEFLLVWLLFYLILNVQLSRLIKRGAGIYENVVSLTKGYSILAFISIVGVICTFSVLAMGLFHRMIIITTDYMEANMEMATDVYSWCFLSVRMEPDAIVRVPFFHDFGILCGLYHEPHILAWNTFPCLILLLGFAKKIKTKFVLIVLAILIVFLGGSATNVFVAIACLTVYFLLKFRTSKFTAIISLLSFVAVVMFYIAYSDGTFIGFLLDRLDSGNSSQQYSADLLSYTFSPKTLLGTNFLSTSFMKGGPSGQDIGYIPCMLFCIFLLMYLRNTVKLLFSSDVLSRAVGFASLYFILHSLKGGMTLFYNTLPLLIMFLQLYILRYGTVRTSKTNR